MSNGEIFCAKYQLYPKSVSPPFLTVLILLSVLFYIVHFLIFLILFNFFFSACGKFLQYGESVKTLKMRKREQQRNYHKYENIVSVYFFRFS